MRRCQGRPVMKVRQCWRDGTKRDRYYCAAHARGADSMSAYGVGFEDLVSVERLPLN